ncbi:MAG: RNA-binding protein [Actinomycetia bacterium]|nr:RNA-binding protein [Actinomycetes bacterium]
MATKLYIGNLSYNTTEAQLNEAFAAHGAVESVALITDRHSGQSKGFAFVEMTDDDEAKKAIRELDGFEMDERSINVSVARPRQERGPGGGGHGGGGGYGGGNRKPPGGHNRERF